MALCSFEGTVSKYGLYASLCGLNVMMSLVMMTCFIKKKKKTCRSHFTQHFNNLLNHLMSYWIQKVVFTERKRKKNDPADESSNREPKQ